jgi:hypothetical protein
VGHDGAGLEAGQVFEREYTPDHLF